MRKHKKHKRKSQGTGQFSQRLAAKKVRKNIVKKQAKILLKLDNDVTGEYNKKYTEKMKRWALHRDRMKDVQKKAEAIRSVPEKSSPVHTNQ